MLYSLKISKISKILLTFSFLVFAVVLLAGPGISLAQRTGIVPCTGPTPTTGPNDVVDPNGCGFVALIQGIQNLLSFLIKFGTIIAVLLFTYAGGILVFSGGNSSKKDEAKKIFWNTAIGFIIILSAWLIVASVLKAFNLNARIDTQLEDAEVTT